jgi:ECF sigma factor
MADDTPPAPSQITELLVAWSEGQREALDDLMPVIYEDLLRMAGGYMRREPAGHPLQPTALVPSPQPRLLRIPGLVRNRRIARVAASRCA